MYLSSAATTLTSWHLLVTFCSLHVALWMKFFEHKPFDSRTVMGFGVLNGISIGLLNLSLGFNSVGFYQVHSYLLNVVLVPVRISQIFHSGPAIITCLVLWYCISDTYFQYMCQYSCRGQEKSYLLVVMYHTLFF